MALINGSNNSDTLFGTSDDDTLNGRGGDDFLVGLAGADVLNGGNGFDIASYYYSHLGVWASLAQPASNTGDAAGDTYSLIEGLQGTLADDTLIGNSADNVLLGEAGNDRLIGGLGADTLNGGFGEDVASYVDAIAAVVASLANPGSNAGEAIGDTFFLVEGLEGSAFDDTLTGDGLDNLLRGGAGADALIGGNGQDTASYERAATGVRASIGNSGTNNGEAAGDTYTSIENLSGSALNDVLGGDGGANVLTGNGGADALNGGNGFDYAGYVNSSVGIVASLASPSGNTGEAAGDTYASIEGLIGSAFADRLTGNNGKNALAGGLGADILVGGAGDDDLYGAGRTPTTRLDQAIDLVDYSAASLGAFGIVVDWSDGTVTGPNTGTDRLFGIEGVIGTLHADTFDATGYTQVLAHAGDHSAYQLIIGGAGDDTIIGNNNTEASYEDATGGIVHTRAAGGTATVSGSGVGIDQLSSLNRIRGSQFADVFNGNGFSDTFDGLGGNDTMNGGDGLDTAEYDGPMRTSKDAIKVMLADGIVEGRSATNNNGTDTLRSMEIVRGTEFADVFDATGFSSRSANAGSQDAFNQFEGRGGTDKVTGNGSTRLVYFSADGVTVNMTGAGKGKADAIHGMELATDTFTKVATITGSQGSDTLNGAGGADHFEGHLGLDVLNGNDGNDLLDGGQGADMLNGGAGVDTATYVSASSFGGVTASLANAAINTGDASGDAYSGIENLTGSNGSDTLWGDSASNVIDGRGGSDTLHGGGGIDTLIGGTGSDIFWFDQSPNAGNVVTVADFNAAEDVFILNATSFSSPFGGMDPGQLDGDALRFGTSAQDLEDRILYDSLSGKLFFDQDGTGGLGKVLFGKVTPGTAMTAENFFIA